MAKFMTGVLLGVGIGLLLAPEKGEETREALADTAGQWRDKFNRMVGRGGARLDDLKKLLASEVSGLSDEVRSRINTILEEEGNAMSDHSSSSYRSEFKPI